MVRGLDVFKAHFAPYIDRYMLIGGVACLMNMGDAGLEFRATKDFDIVLCVEALDTKFALAFWEFVKQGRYQNKQKSTGKKLYYRFSNPEDTHYPLTLELFSRIPDALTLLPGSHITPVPVDEGVSSLSAILLNDDYYRMVRAGTKEVDGLPIVLPEYLIPLKARAWLDLTTRRNAGEHVDDRDIRKHRNDVLRLYQLLTPNAVIVLPAVVHNDLLRFLQMTEEARDIDMQKLKLSYSQGQACSVMRRIYQPAKDE